MLKALEFWAKKLKGELEIDLWRSLAGEYRWWVRLTPNRTAEQRDDDLPYMECAGATFAKASLKLLNKLNGRCEECGIETTRPQKIYLPTGIKAWVCDKCFEELYEAPLEQEEEKDE